MRRLIAFLITLTTLIIIVAVNVLPYFGSNATMNLETDNKFGLDYRGGYEILYEIERTDGKKLTQSKIESIIDTLNTQIKATGLTNPTINIETGDGKRAETKDEQSNFVRISLPISAYVTVTSISSLLESDNILTFRAEDGTLLGRGEDLLNENKFASVSTEGRSSRITLNFTKSGYETFLGFSKDSSIASTSEENSATTGNVVIWLGYKGADHEDIDNYEDDIDKFSDFTEYHETVSKYGINVLTQEQKIIYNRYLGKIVGYTTFSVSSEELGTPQDLSSYSEEDKTITLGNFTYNSEQANSIVDNINRGEISDYMLHQISLAKIPAVLDTGALQRSVIAFIIGLFIVCIFLIVMYRLSGLAASFALIAHTTISIFLYRAFGGIFGPVIFVGLLISLAIAIDAIIIMFERTKDEMYKGKTLERSFSEASRKVNSAVIDANIVTFLVSIVIFLFGVQEIRSAATMLAIASASIIVVIILLVKVLANCLFKSDLLKGKYSLFIPNVKDVPDVQKGELQTNFGKFTKVNFFKNTKNFIKGVGGVLGVAIVAALIFLFATGSPVNLNSDYLEYTKIAVQTNLDKNSETQIFQGQELSVFILEQFDIEADYSGTNADIKYYNSKKASKEEVKVNFTSYVLEFESTLSKEQVEKINNIFIEFEKKANEMNEENKQIDKDKVGVDQYLFTFTINTAKNYSNKAIFGNSFLVIGLSLAVIFVYLAIRFKYTYAIAAVVGVAVDIIIIYALLALFHLEFTVLSLVTIALVACYSINDKVIIFDRIRENVLGAKKKIFTHEERVEFANRSLQQTAYRGLIVIGATFICLVIVAIVGGASILNIATVLIIAIVASAFTSMVVCPLLWIFFDDRLTLRNQNKKPRREKKKANIDEVQEQIFIGIND